MNMILLLFCHINTRNITNWQSKLVLEKEQGQNYTGKTNAGTENICLLAFASYKKKKFLKGLFPV